MNCVSSFNHLVGAGKKGRWDFEAERFAGLQVDHQLELGDYSTGKSGFGPLRIFAV
jgi:hypothetical protein